MVLDEPKNADEVFAVNGITYFMAKDFFDRVKPIMVDYIDSSKGSEFSISSVAYRFNLRVFLQNPKEKDKNLANPQRY